MITIGRRGFLVGAGATLALPFLDSISLGAVTRPKRLAFVFVPNGVHIDDLGVLVIPFTQSVALWSIEAGFIGVGMAMLYPNLGAAVGDFSPVQYRASLMGVYRFWRDSGYAIGALLMGMMAQWSMDLLMPFWFVGSAMLLSGLVVLLCLPTKNQSHV